MSSDAEEVKERAVLYTELVEGGEERGEKVCGSWWAAGQTLGSHQGRACPTQTRKPKPDEGCVPPDSKLADIMTLSPGRPLALGYPLQLLRR